MAPVLFLLLAILLEVAGTTSMKLAQGFTKPVPSVMIFVFYSLAFICLTFSLKRLDISVAYAIWSGVGTSLIVIIGFFYFHEPITAIQMGALMLIIAGVVGLNLGTR